MNTGQWRAVQEFVYHFVIWAGALACVLVWFKIEPTDLWGWHLPVTLPHWLWLVAAIVLFAVGICSSGYSLYRAFNPATEVIEPASLPQPAEALRPLVVPVRYGKRADNRVGLFVVNEIDGQPAYDVTIENVPFGSRKLIFNNPSLPRFSHGGEHLFEAYIERDPRSTILGEGLQSEMAGQNVASIFLFLRYKDRNNVGYVTKGAIERNVSSPNGLDVRYLMHDTSSPLTVGEGIQESDPRIYLHEILDTYGNFPATPFTVENRGGGVAHKIQIQPMKFGGKTVTFPYLDSLPINASKQILPAVQGTGMTTHSVLGVLAEAWNDSGKTQESFSLSPFPFSIRITYEDFKHRKIGTTVALTYSYVQESFRQRNPDRKFGLEHNIFEITNTEFEVN